MGIVEDIKEEVKKDTEIAKKEGVGVIDIVTEKIVSRKLFVWMVASFMLFTSKLQSEDWVAVSLAYIGIQGVADIAAKWRGSKNV